MMTRLKSLFAFAGRTFQIFSQGFAGYAGILISLVSELLIIYNFALHKYFPGPAPTVILLALLGGAFLFSYLLGWIAQRSGFWAEQNAVNAEQSPYLAKILGKKDLYGWQGSLINTELGIESNKLSIQFYKAQGLDTSALEKKLEALIAYKAKIEEILKTADKNGKQQNNV